MIHANGSRHIVRHATPEGIALAGVAGPVPPALLRHAAQPALNLTDSDDEQP